LETATPGAFRDVRPDAVGGAHYLDADGIARKPIPSNTTSQISSAKLSDIW
jgi:hypothetical protein